MAEPEARQITQALPQSRPLRVAFVAFTIAGPAGGAEKMLALLANSWAGSGRDVSIITFDAGTDARPVDPSITLLPLSLASGGMPRLRRLFTFLLRLWRLRQTLKTTKPDIIVAFIDKTNIQTLIAAAGLRTPVVISERVDPRLYGLALPWRLLRRITYSSAAALVVQTEAARSFFHGSLRTRTVVVPNAVVLPAGESSIADRPRVGSRRTLIAMGRLVPQKGFDLLLEAFELIAHSHPDWDLVIYGEGEMRPELEERAERRVPGRVRFPGHTEKPSDVMCGADLFVLSSRSEGFPNVLVEAMACGLPVVAFDCPSGPREIVRHGVDGLLVAPLDVRELSTAMARLMEQEPERKRLGTRGREVILRFGLDAHLEGWERVVGLAMGGVQRGHYN